MIYKFKRGDSFIEVDSEFPADQVDTFENMLEEDSLGDTIEIKIEELEGDES